MGTKNQEQKKGPMLEKLFENQVKKTPQNWAVKVNNDGYTYEALNHYAQQIAMLIQHTLKKDNTGERPRIALLLPHGVEMIAAIIGVFKAGYAYIPLSIDYPVNRLSYMIENGGASLLLTMEKYQELASQLTQETKIDYQVLETTTNPSNQDNTKIGTNNLEIKQDALAYIMYTSGSTGRPKGVMQVHDRVYYYVRNWIRMFQITETDRLTLFSSFCHDGSVQDMWAGLLTGACLYPMDIRNREGIDTLIKFLNDEKITIWHSVPSLYAFFANTVSPHDQFPFLRWILLGGEPVRQHEINMFNRFFHHSSLANVYGQTESSVSTIRIFHLNEKIEYFSIGQPLDQTHILVLNDNDTEVEAYEIGEIVINCPHLSPGYWNNPEATGKVFVHDPDLGPVYFTGDLGRLLPDGNIEFMGRRDSQVKLRGFRIELGEIESHLLKHQYVSEAVVIARNNPNNEKELCGYYVPSHYPLNTENINKNQETELRNFLTQEIPDYMIPTYLIPLEKLPLTQSGKIDRNALPLPESIKNINEYSAPQTKLEKDLTEIWSDILISKQKKQEKPPISIHDNFFRLGGHSLTAVTLVSRLHKLFDLRLPVAILFRYPTIHELATFLETQGHTREKFSTIPPVTKNEYYKLSSAQRRLYILHKLDETGTGYHLPGFFQLKGNVDINKLENVLQELIKRHESLRTSFHEINGEPFQKIHENVEFYLKPWNGETNEKGFKTFINPFDLAHAPLIRAGISDVIDNSRVLLIDCHHIITDGISFVILLKEITLLYQGLTLLPLAIQYKDYCAWQTSTSEKENRDRTSQYWINLFTGEIPVLNLPLDFPRPPNQRFEGAHQEFDLDEPVTQSLKTLTLETDSTLYIVLLTMFNIWLARLCNQEDIVVGTVVSGRNHEELQSVVGMFVNTLALRNQPASEKTVLTFLQEVKNSTLKAFDNQDYLFEDLVEQVNIKRDISRNPIFDVTFRLQNLEMQADEIVTTGDNQGILIRAYTHESLTSKFDLTLAAMETSDKIHFKMEYSTHLFKAETIERWTVYFKQVVKSALATPNCEISRVELLGENEKIEVLYQFNDTLKDIPAGLTISRWFSTTVEQYPDRQAVATNQDGEKTLTYEELDGLAVCLAQELVKQGINQGSIVGIMVEPCLELAIAVLAVLKAGGAYLPINPGQPRLRLEYILADSQATILLALPHAEIPTRLNVPVIPLDLNELQAIKYKETGINHEPSDLVYVIYTSGTTGKAKGVCLTHGNLVNYVHWFSSFASITPHDQSILTASFAFDLGYTAFYPTLLNGGCIHLVSRETYADAGTLLDYINREGVTYLKITPSLFATLAERVETLPGYLPGLRLIVLGGEGIKLKDVETVHQVSPHIQFINHYGPTEATIGCVAQYIDFSRFEVFKQQPTIGKPITNNQVVILDNHGGLQGIGIPGELCISGKSLARGYLNRPGLTREKFTAVQWLVPVKQETKYSQERGWNLDVVYHTGDLARWTLQGEIEFLGRIDHQVKIRGFRIELGEIENQLSSHPGVEATAIVVLERGEGERLICAYWVKRGEAGNAVDGNELRVYLAERLPDYMIPAYFVLLERIPLTANGKLDRGQLPEPGISRVEAITLPRDTREKKLISIWAAVLGIDESQMGIDTRFFEIGGHSLTVIRMLAQVHRVFLVKVPMQEVFKNPTVRGLAAYVQQAVQEKFSLIEAVEEKEYYVCSPSQKRLYILQQMKEDSIFYNMPHVYQLESGFDPVRLERALVELIQRHESLRTSFHLIGDGPVQKVHECVDFHWEFIAREGHRQEMYKAFVRPFNLAVAPLFRAGLLINKNENWLFLDMHHIIADGVSWQVWVRELRMLLDGEGLGKLGLRYRDFAEWQNQENFQEMIKEQGRYWLERFRGEIPVLQLPVDYERPAVQVFTGKKLYFTLGAGEKEMLLALSRQGNVTVFMVLVAALQVFLSKLTGEEDIIVGVPVVGRRHADLEGVVGIFINTLVLRGWPVGQKRVGEFLEETREMMLEAFENQEYPFEELVECLQIKRDTGRNPLFDVILAIQEGASKNALVAEVSRMGMEWDIARFDLTFFVQEMVDGLVFCLQYATALFKEETAVRFGQFFQRILAAVVREPGLAIWQLEMMADEEKLQLLEGWSRAGGVEYSGQETLTGYFSSQVERVPDRVAVFGVLADSMMGLEPSFPLHLTYRELDRIAGSLAVVLKERGVEVGAIVGLLMERSLEMIVAIWGVLKCGAVYLPMDPGFPAERLVYMLADSGAGLVIMGGVSVEVREKISLWSGERLDISLKRWWSVACLQEPEVKEVGMAGLVYIIYTSGTTGKPKGTMTMHGNVIRVVKETNYIDLSERDRLLQLSNYAFDGSTFDIYGSLLNGGLLVMVSREEMGDLDCLGRVIEREQVTVFFITTALFNALVDLNPRVLMAVRKVLFGGERVSVEHTRKALAFMGAGRILHVYGPTEATVFATYYPVDGLGEKGLSIPIGKPLTHTSLYILDKYNKPVPWGVYGELYIGGEGVARGYMNRPGLTAEKFIWLEKSELYGGEKGDRVGLLYRTGDIVRWRDGGLVEFLGRVDQQVKIRGFRIELGEVEARLSEYPGVGEVVVRVWEDEVGDKQICAYMVLLDKSIELAGFSGVREYLGGRLPFYMVPSYFVGLEKMPLNVSGKVDLRRLPVPGVGVGGKYIGPRDRLEEELVNVWAGVLGVSGEGLGIDANFFHVGGNSLKGTVLVSRVHKEFNVRVSLGQLFAGPRLQDMADYIRRAVKSGYFSIPCIEECKYYPLSYNQERLWFIHQEEPASPAYHMKGEVGFEHEVEVGILQRVLGKMVERHESLRTVFWVEGHRPVQVINPVEEFRVKFEVVDIAMMEEGERDEREGRMVRVFSQEPFDLRKGPLFRVLLIKRLVGLYRMVYCFHHIIADGWSLEVWRREFMQLYEGYCRGEAVELGELWVRYRDYVVWQRGEVEGQGESHESYQYWSRVLSTGVPVVQLPRLVGGDGLVVGGAGYKQMLSMDLKESLHRIARENGTSLFVVMFSLYLLVLRRYANQEDVVASIISAGRGHESLAGVVGFFVHSLLFKCRVDDEEVFQEYLQRVHGQVMEVFQHQDYPLERVLEDLRMVYPEVGISFNMMNLPGRSGGEEIEYFNSYHIPVAADVKFDLEAYVGEYRNGLTIYWSYRRSIYDAQTVEYLATDYVRLLEYFSRNVHHSYHQYKSSIREKKRTFKK